MFGWCVAAPIGEAVDSQEIVIEDKKKGKKKQAAEVLNPSPGEQKGGDATESSKPRTKLQACLDSHFSSVDALRTEPVPSWCSSLVREDGTLACSICSAVVRPSDGFHAFEEKDGKKKAKPHAACRECYTGHVGASALQYKSLSVLCDWMEKSGVELVDLDKLAERKPGVLTREALRDIDGGELFFSNFKRLQQGGDLILKRSPPSQKNEGSRRIVCAPVEMQDRSPECFLICTFSYAGQGPPGSPHPDPFGFLQKALFQWHAEVTEAFRRATVIPEPSPMTPRGETRPLPSPLSSSSPPPKLRVLLFWDFLSINRTAGQTQTPIPILQGLPLLYGSRHPNVAFLQHCPTAEEAAFLTSQIQMMQQQTPHASDLLRGLPHLRGWPQFEAALSSFKPPKNVWTTGTEVGWMSGAKAEALAGLSFEIATFPGTSRVPYSPRDLERALDPQQGEAPLFRDRRDAPLLVQVYTEGVGMLALSLKQICLRGVRLVSPHTPSAGVGMPPRGPGGSGLSAVERLSRFLSFLKDSTEMRGGRRGCALADLDLTDTGIGDPELATLGPSMALLPSIRRVALARVRSDPSDCIAPLTPVGLSYYCGPLLKAVVEENTALEMAKDTDGGGQEYPVAVAQRAWLEYLDLSGVLDAPPGPGGVSQWGGNVSSSVPSPARGGDGFLPVLEPLFRELPALVVRPDPLDAGQLLESKWEWPAVVYAHNRSAMTVQSSDSESEGEGGRTGPMEGNIGQEGNANPPLPIAALAGPGVNDDSTSS